ncbi:MAG TPA: hypothetical protein DEG13_14015 [Candidatus Microthrix parvicella]|nr:hypothetical protein [Candidatus Microthrix parvicella]
MNPERTIAVRTGRRTVATRSAGTSIAHIWATIGTISTVRLAGDQQVAGLGAWVGSGTMGSLQRPHERPQSALGASGAVPAVAVGLVDRPVDDFGASITGTTEVRVDVDDEADLRRRPRSIGRLVGRVSSDEFASIIDALGLAFGPD